METALLSQLRAATDHVMRDTLPLEVALAGAGMKDDLLMNWIGRYHWAKNHIQQAKGAYRHQFSQELDSRICEKD
jgi:annexin A7/11